MCEFLMVLQREERTKAKSFLFPLCTFFLHIRFCYPLYARICINFMYTRVCTWEQTVEECIHKASQNFRYPKRDRSDTWTLWKVMEWCDKRGGRDLASTTTHIVVVVSVRLMFHLRSEFHSLFSHCLVPRAHEFLIRYHLLAIQLERNKCLGLVYEIIVVENRFVFQWNGENLAEQTAP